MKAMKVKPDYLGWLFFLSLEICFVFVTCCGIAGLIFTQNYPDSFPTVCELSTVRIRLGLFLP